MKTHLFLFSGNVKVTKKTILHGAEMCDVVLLVPYRPQQQQNREAHLTHFLHVMPGILDAALGASRWAILVIEQSKDDQKFSRARCLNAGARIAAVKYPGATLVLHDVDLIPDVERARGYAAKPPENGVIAFNTDSAKYNKCAMYVGGICSVSQPTFETVNGFQNSFQGWGGEDDCFRDAIRLQQNAETEPAAWLHEFKEGTVTDLEDSDDAAVYSRACNVPALRCEKSMKVENRRVARETGFAHGLAQLVFEVVRVKTFQLPPPALPTPNVALYLVNLYVMLKPGWSMAMSRSRHVPYYYRLLDGESTYLCPRKNVGVLSEGKPTAGSCKRKRGDTASAAAATVPLSASLFNFFETKIEPVE